MGGPGEPEDVLTTAVTEGDGIGPAAGEPFEIGQRVGRYVLVDRIGQGGMGEVFRAYDPELDRIVVIKHVLAAHDREDARVRLQREAQAIAQVSHSHVVQVFDVGTDERSGDTFIAMEFVDGTTLRRWLHERKRPWQEITGAFRQAGLGLIAAHRHGLVHRDFKPDNVLIASDGTAKVVDFGLAKPADTASSSHASLSTAGLERNVPLRAEDSGALRSPITRIGAQVGTPAYMPPEQVAGLPVDARADQFAFATALYEALFDRLPFAGDTPAAYAMEAFSGNVIAPPVKTRVPKALQQAILRALQSDPERRFPDLQPLLDLLARDPAVIRRRWITTFATVGLGVVVAQAGSWATRSSAPADACMPLGDRVDEGWNDARRQAVARALTVSDRPFSAATAARVVERLDEVADRWRNARIDACLAARSTAVAAPTEAADMRVVCLERALDQLGRLGELVEKSGAEVLERVDDAVAHADARVRRCSEPAYLEGLSTASEAEAEGPERIELERADQELDLGLVHDAERRLVALPTPESDTAPLYALRLELLLARLARERGEYAVAEARLHDAASAALGGRVSLWAAEWQRELGSVALGQSKLEIADRAFSRAVAWFRRDLGEDAVETIRAEGELGHVPYARGDYEAARIAYERATVHAAKTLAPDDLDRITVDGYLADTLSHLGRFDESIALRRDVVARMRSARGDGHPMTLDAIDDLALSHLRRGAAAEALPLLHETLVARRADARLDNPLAEVSSLANIGACHTSLGELDRAEARLREAAALLTDRLGEEALPQRRAIEANLASVLTKAGRFTAALELLDRVIPAMATADELATSNGLTALMTQADALVGSGQPARAARVLDRALALVGDDRDDATTRRLRTRHAELGRKLDPTIADRR